MPAKITLMIASAIGLVAGAGAMTMVGGTDRAATEKIIREYILEHPELLPEAMKRLHARETGKMISGQRALMETPFAGAWAGSAKPSATLVMFTDYSCGYCRTSVTDVDRLLAGDKGLRVVWREIPILGPGSEVAARAALVAARQGRYLDFHRRMFAEGPPDEESVERVRRATGVTGEAAAAVNAEIEQNLKLARALGLTGTPSFVIGDQILQGAVGYEALKSAVDRVRTTS